jgi:hypothetical protein
MRNLLLSLLAVLITVSLYSQDKTPEQKYIQYKHGFGIAGGFSYNYYGLIYKYHLNPHYALQANFAPSINSDKSVYNFGITAYRYIDEKFFVYLVNNLNSESSEDVYHNYHSPYEEFRFKKNIYHLNTSLGIGVELLKNKRIGINVMCGYLRSYGFPYKETKYDYDYINQQLIFYTEEHKKDLNITVSADVCIYYKL